MENSKEKVIVNLRGCCALCLAHPNESLPNSTVTSLSLPVPVTCKDFDNLWSNIFTNTNCNEFPRKEFLFLSGAGKTQMETASMVPHYVCSPCTRKIARISAIQNELVQLERRLEMLRKEMEGLVESVRKQMKDATVPQNRRKEGLNSSRFKKLLQEISNQKMTSKYLESTVYYLGLVGDCKLYNPMQSSNDQGTLTSSSSTTSAKGIGIISVSGDSDSGERSALSTATATAAQAIVQTSNSTNAGTTSSAKGNKGTSVVTSTSSALLSKLGKSTGGQSQGREQVQLIQTSKLKPKSPVSKPMADDYAPPIKKLKVMTPSKISHVTSSGNEEILGTEEDDDDSRTATASENEDEDEDQDGKDYDHDPLGNDIDNNDVPVIVNVKSKSTVLNNSRRKQSFDACAGTPPSSSSLSSKENKTTSTSVSGGCIDEDGCASASASALLFNLGKSTPTISTSKQVVQTSKTAASPASASTSSTSMPPVKRSKLITPPPSTSTSSSLTWILPLVDVAFDSKDEEDIKSEDLGENGIDDDDDDYGNGHSFTEMDPLAYTHTDSVVTGKGNPTETELISSSTSRRKQSLSDTTVMGMVKSKQNDIFASGEKQELKEEDNEDFPPDSIRHCGVNNFGDDYDDSFSLASLSDSENDMNSNDMSTALTLFQSNLKTKTAGARTSKAPTKKPIPKSSIVTVVKETPKITLPSSSSSEGPRVVTLKSGMTTTELNPNMTIEERLAFIRTTIGPQRQSKSKNKTAGAKTSKASTPKKPVPIKSATIGVPCPICGVLKLNREMLSHLKDDHSLEDYVFPCPNQRCCKVYFSKFSEHYSRHLAKNRRCWIAAGRPPLDQVKCSTCGETFAKGRGQPPRKAFHSHLKCHETPEKVFKCPIPHCKEEFTEKQSVELHLVSHGVKRDRHNKSLQPCAHCPILYVGKGRKKLKPELMRSHLKNKHGIKDEDILECSLCPFVFSSRAELMDHWQVHLIEGKEVSCDICNSTFTFTKSTELRDHFYSVHGIGEKYLCGHGQCEYSTYSMDNFRHHSRIMHSAPFVCEYCEKSLRCRERLERHVVQCAADRERLTCKYCSASKTFPTVAERECHEEQVHFITCELCTKLILWHRINNHFRKRHQKTPEFYKEFNCPECDMTFKHSTTWKAHNSSVHLGRTLICDKCGQRFSHPNHLKKHEKTKICLQPQLQTRGKEADEKGNQGLIK